MVLDLKRFASFRCAALGTPRRPRPVRSFSQKLAIYSLIGGSTVQETFQVEENVSARCSECSSRDFAGLIPVVGAGYHAVKPTIHPKIFLPESREPFLAAESTSWVVHLFPY
jgi:hypothetical protein